MNRPLCPVCYREACTWLAMEEVRRRDWTKGHTESRATPERVCPHFGQPLPPASVRRLTDALQRNSGDHT